MANVSIREELESLPIGIFNLPGEPAILINGVPPMPPVTDTPAPSNVLIENELPKGKGLGIWLEGREVQKMFGEQIYNGKVTEFDKETGWYRVVYEDGDVEDLEWHELEQLISPLDISLPLKALTLKMVKKRERPTPVRGLVGKRGR